MFKRGLLVAFTFLAITLPLVAAVEVRRLQDSSCKTHLTLPPRYFLTYFLRALRPAVRSDWGMAGLAGR